MTDFASCMERIPTSTWHQHRLALLGCEAGTLTVGVEDTPSPSLLRDLAFMTGLTVVPTHVEPHVIDDFLGTVATPAPPSIPHTERGTSIRSAVPLKPSVPQGPVVQQVDRIIREAIERRASDIHFEPYEAFFRVRYRLDGVLHQVGELSLLQREAIMSRLKIMAGLDIAEKRRPQDGRIRFQHGDRRTGRTIDLRVSTLPTEFGEKIVLRILDKGHLRLDLEALGFEAGPLTLFRRAIHQPYGIILVSGPTGSGKTTTLYAALNELNTDAVNITTIEDPIEYNLPGINQTHVRSDIGLSFAHALRAFLRQDPNIIMVGEIRDRETAEVAIRAALTGHLVLSTIHTNDAASTITRLVDMGIEPFLVASSLRLALAQRLVRRICPDCKHATTLDPAFAEAYGLEPEASVYSGTGCATCMSTGYRGRTALFEVLPISERMTELITQQSTAYALRQQAMDEGMRTLRTVGIECMERGDTTPEEIVRETSF